MFRIYTVPYEAAEFSEQMGTKFKFWYFDAQLGLTLFKEGRPGTGENWAEKVAAELARALGIPHARYELASWRNRLGTISPSFVSKYSQLIHGNELVGGKITVDAADSKVRYYQERSHTHSRVFAYLKQHSEDVSIPEGFIPSPGISNIFDMFVGYLMFDAWIANQDRHAENWGIIRSPDRDHLAPTYDHGSSLGRQETDEKRKYMMTTKDRGASIDAYVEKATSAMYPSTAANVKVKAYRSIELLKLGFDANPIAARAWQSKLDDFSSDMLCRILAGVPENIMSPVAKSFTERLLMINRRRILELT